jgi:hypothetical protein
VNASWKVCGWRASPRDDNCKVDLDSGRYLSENFAFCRRWRDIGGKTNVDLGSKLEHLGQQVCSGGFAESTKLQGRW